MSSLRVPLQIAVICAAATFALAGCTPDKKGDEDNLADVAANLSNLMPIPDTPSTLDRAGMLDAIGAATSAYAAGIDDGADQRALVGRRFAFRMPFGCSGYGSNPSDPLRLTIRDDAKSYEARVSYSIRTKDVPFDALPAAEGDEPRPPVELVEGFWIEQPWLLAEQCPAPVDEPVEAGADTDAAEKDASPDREHSVGLARFVTPDDSRVGSRSGRDYVKVVTLEEGEAPPPGMFLLIEGRLRAWPDGKVVHCRPAPSGNRPNCIAGASIDRVAFERVDNRALVAEWTN